jgi:RNA polymerase sigma-70 factor (family 1)
MVTTYGDDQLADLLRSGNEDAFTEIYARYWKLLFYIAAKRLRNHSEAEEAVQNIFTDLWARKASIVIRSSLKYYLAAAVQYQVMNHLAKRKNVSGIEGTGDRPANTPADQYLNFHELEQQIQELVTALPEKCRLVYELSREHGLSNKDIAAQLGISEKTVENQLTKALARLRAGLGDSAFLFLLVFSLRD